MFKKTLISLAVASSLGLTGCLSDADEGGNANPDYKISNPAIDGKTWPVFNPVTGELPIPNDLIFDSEQGDGTFGVDDTKPPVTTALNELSGASTVAPAVIQFNGKINKESVAYGETVFLIELTYASGDPVQGLSNQEPPTVAGLAKARADVETLDGMSAIRILPLEPLNPRKRYVAVATKGITDINGDAIIASPSYGSLTDENQPLGTATLAPVRALINSLWEATAGGFFAKAGLPLTADDIAISYSLTTSNDKKVLQYIAEPAAWFADQLTTFIKVKATKQLVGAAKFAKDPADSSLTVKAGFDFNADEKITAADFDVNQDGNFTAADFDLSGDSKFDYEDTSLIVTGAIANFPSAGVKAVIDKDDECSGSGETFINCIATGLAAKFAAALPAATPDNRGASDFSLGVPTPVALVSSVAASVYKDVADEITKAGKTPPTVLSVQGTVSLPYYLGTSKADILANSWQADSALATNLNGAFKDLGLQIPQADANKSTAVNYIFPFPKKTEDVDVPVLIIYPKEPATKGVVMYQHGITTDRSAALSFGTALATLGYTVVAIDQPLHGIAAFTKKEQDELATKLLKAGQKAGLPDALASTAQNNGALIAGQLNVVFVSQATEQNATTAQTIIDAVLGGDTSEDFGVPAEKAENLDMAIKFLEGAENSVANAGSTIPGLAPRDGKERHFGFYAPTPGSLAPIADSAGKGDSGSMFINLLNFTNTRDNIRQSAVDQMNLRVSLNGLSLLELGGADLSTGNVQFNFAGHSLGSITGAPFIASVNANQLPAILSGGDPATMTPPSPESSSYNDIAAVNMLTPGGGIVRLLENSPTFAPRILNGLGQKGLTQGDASLESFLNVFQAAVDTSDPVNFVNDLKSTTDAYLLSEVEGDAVIPNAADKKVWGVGALSATIPASEAVPVAVTVDSFPAPLAGTRPLTLMFDEGVDSSFFTSYTEADFPADKGEDPLSHKTPVSGAPAAAFSQMVTEAAATFKPTAP